MIVYLMPSLHWQSVRDQPHRGSLNNKKQTISAYHDRSRSFSPPFPFFVRKDSIIDWRFDGSQQAPYDHSEFSGMCPASYSRYAFSEWKHIFVHYHVPFGYYSLFSKFSSRKSLVFLRQSATHCGYGYHERFCIVNNKCKPSGVAAQICPARCYIGKCRIRRIETTTVDPDDGI